MTTQTQASGLQEAFEDRIVEVVAVQCYVCERGRAVVLSAMIDEDNEVHRCHRRHLTSRSYRKVWLTIVA